VAVFVILSLPETSGRNMLESIEEAEAFYLSSNTKGQSIAATRKRTNQKNRKCDVNENEIDDKNAFFVADDIL